MAAIPKRNLKLPGDPRELYEVDKDKETSSGLEFLPHGRTFRL